MLRPPKPSLLVKLFDSLPLMFCLRLLSIVPATVGTGYLLSRVFESPVDDSDGGESERQNGSKAECLLACFWVRFPPLAFPSPPFALIYQLTKPSPSVAVRPS